MIAEYTVRVHGSDEVSAYWCTVRAKSPAAALTIAKGRVAEDMYDDAGGIYYVVPGRVDNGGLGIESAAVLTEAA